MPVPAHRFLQKFGADQVEAFALRVGTYETSCTEADEIKQPRSSHFTGRLIVPLIDAPRVWSLSAFQASILLVRVVWCRQEPVGAQARAGEGRRMGWSVVTACCAVRCESR